MAFCCFIPVHIRYTETAERRHTDVDSRESERNISAFFCFLILVKISRNHSRDFIQMFTWWTDKIIFVQRLKFQVILSYVVVKVLYMRNTHTQYWNCIWHKHSLGLQDDLFRISLWPLKSFIPRSLEPTDYLISRFWWSKVTMPLYGSGKKRRTYT